MDISCDIIRDILPLYAEDLVSSATRELVDEHLCGCDGCTKQLGILKKAAKLPVDVEVTSLKRVENTIRRRRILSVLAAVWTVLTLVVTGFVYMLTPVYLTAEEAIEGVELREDGGLAIDYASGIMGNSGYATDENFQNWGIMCNTTRYDWLRAKLEERVYADLAPEDLEDYILEKYDAEEMTRKMWDRFHDIHVTYGTWVLPNGEFLHEYDPEVWVEGNGEWAYRTSTINHWYLDVTTGEESTLLWKGVPGEYVDPPVHPLIEANYVYAVLFAAAGILGIGSIFVSRKCHSWKKELAVRFGILSGALGFSVLLVTGGQLVIGEMWAEYKWMDYILIETVFVALTALFWQRLYSMNKKDKGV